MADFYGWCEVLFYGNLPFHVITEDELTPQQLASYRILILPAVTCLSSAQCKYIKDWTSAGGTLIATHNCAMYDETGEPLNQSGLSTVLGVDIIKKRYCYSPVLVPAEEDIFRGCGGWIDDPDRTRFECVPHHGTEVFGQIERDVNAPAMVRNSFGNGTSVYFAFRLGSAAWLRAKSCFIFCDPNRPDPNCSDPNNQYITLGPTTPSTYQIILNLMAPVRHQLPFTVDADAPLGLIVTLHKLADGKQILHMLNATGTAFVLDGKLHVVEKHSVQIPLVTQDIKVTLSQSPDLPVTAHLPSGYDVLLDVDTSTNTITVPGFAISPYTIIETGAWPSADLNRDGIVDFEDFAILAAQWLETES